jgi:hypothetical protein
MQHIGLISLQTSHNEDSRRVEMDGTYFYWIAWFFWILTTFFMKKSKERYLFTVIILLLIIFSNKVIVLDIFRINASLGITLLSCYVFLALFTEKNNYKKVVYLLVCTLTITTAYVSFHLFELFDPIWVVFNRTIMLVFCLVYLTLLLIKDRKKRVLCMMIGACQGELLYAFILKNFPFEYEIGALSFLDVMALSVFTIFIWSALEYTIKYFDTYFEKTTKEKHG